MLPISVEVNAGAVVAAGGDYPHSLEFVEGVPLCAVDMFSETGRSCLREWVSRSDRLKGFLARHVHGGTPARLLHMGLFHVESSILGRFLTAPASRKLTSETEEEEMRHLGMTDPSRRVELREILTSESEDLAKIRRRRLLELGSSPLTGEQLHLGLES